MTTIGSTYETPGILALNAGESVTIGWEMFDGEFPPLTEHSALFGGPGRCFVRVRGFDQQGFSNGSPRAFFYTLQNLDVQSTFVGLNYIWFKIFP